MQKRTLGNRKLEVSALGLSCMRMSHDESLIPDRQEMIALYRTNELPFHIARARENGVSKDELVELFTHLAFYAGWPSAMTAINIAMQVLAKTE